jgi:hemerythrin-like metal-binding protein
MEINNSHNLNNIDKLNSELSSYARFIPFQLLKLLGKNNFSEICLGDQAEMRLTILFSDIREFTTISESLTPRENFKFINSYISQMEPIISNNNGIIDKILGDGIIAIFPSNADDAVSCSILMLECLKLYNDERKTTETNPVRIGIGLNTGLCMLGIVGGLNKMESAIIGDTVNLSSRLECLTKIYGVLLLISENTLHSLKNVDRYSIRFIDRVLVKGKIQPQSIYEVFDNDIENVKKLKNDTKSLFEEALANYHYRKIDVAKDLLEKCIEINPDDNPAKVYLERCRNFRKNGFHEGAKELCQQIEWNSEFEIGYPEIDKQHFELISNSIKLLNSIDKGVDKFEIDKLIAFIDYYVITHFKTEEKYLSDNHYPFIKHQKKQHQNFIRSFKFLKTEISLRKLNKTYLMFRIQILLIDWVVNHTLKEDQHYGRYIKNNSRQKF